MTYLNPNRQIIFFDTFIVKWMIDFDVGPSVPVVRSLL